MTQTNISELWPKTKKFTLKNVNLWRWEFSALPLFWRDFLQSEDLFSGSSKKNFFFFVFTVPLSDLASSLKCKLLFSSHTKVLLFRPHITRKKPKTFSMNIFFIKKMLLKSNLFQNQHRHSFSSYFPPTFEFFNSLLSWFWLWKCV